MCVFSKKQSTATIQKTHAKQQIKQTNSNIVFSKTKTMFKTHDFSKTIKTNVQEHVISNLCLICVCVQTKQNQTFVFQQQHNQKTNRSNMCFQTKQKSNTKLFKTKQKQKLRTIEQPCAPTNKKMKNNKQQHLKTNQMNLFLKTTSSQACVQRKQHNTAVSNKTNQNTFSTKTQ